MVDFSLNAASKATVESCWWSEAAVKIVTVLYFHVTLGCHASPDTESVGNSTGGLRFNLPRDGRIYCMFGVCVYLMRSLELHHTSLCASARQHRGGEAATRAGAERRLLA